MKYLKYSILLLPFVIIYLQLKSTPQMMVSANRLNELIKEKDIFLVDVHIPEQRHIKGTDLFLPFNKIPENAHLFPKDLTEPIYLYCEGGPMGDKAARELTALGYKKVYNLEGGTIAWEKAGFEFE